jgi:eukaryotic-like serine/threonine-protein kinase
LGRFKKGDVILDKYEVTRVLGKGGMGEVLATHNRTLDKLVALKFIHPSLEGNDDAVARFVHEGRTAAGIDNDHVARVFDVQMLDEVPFIVMEYLDGKDLAAVLEERGKLEFVETADLLLQACEGIHEAHAKGVVHRDLKPGNLFVTSRQGRPLVKVLDFGIAKSTAAPGVTATAGAAVFGSPRYMSPEQFVATRDVDVRTDVWSLGVILYELLTGKPPFPGEAVPEVYAAIHQGAYTPPSRYRPDIPPALEKLISDALAHNREKRLPNIEAFAAPLATLASPVGLASFHHIQRGGSEALAASDPSAAPDVAEASLDSMGRVAVSEETLPRRGGSTTDASIVPPRSKTEPPARRWPRYAALGVLAATAASAIVVPRYRHAAAAADPGLTTVDPPPTSSASAGSDPVPGDDTKSTGPSTADSAVVVSTDAGQAPPSTASTGAEHASAQGLGTVGAQGTPGGASACASGATAACEAACAAKRPGSCEKLADALFSGTGAPKDAARASSLYQTTCDGGSAVACNDLGIHYALADGVPKDALKALSLYRRACEMGSAKACVNAGAMHYQGSGVDKDYGLGVSFFQRACEKKEASGCNNVSIAYATGHYATPDTVTPNMPRSLEFADLACKMGLGAACIAAAQTRIAGKGVDKDVNGGIDQLKARCNNRDPNACDALAKLYTDGSGQDVPADPPLGHQYLEKACGFGSALSCAKLGVRGKIDTSRSDLAQGKATLQASCDKGDARSCGMMGELLTKGTAEERAKAAGLLRQGCDGGYAAACGRLGGGVQ